MQAAADVTQETRQKRHHGASHTGHFDQEPEKDKKRHSEQDKMAHPLVHATDQNHQRRMGGERKVSKDRKSKGKGDRHAGKTVAATTPTKKIRRLRLPNRRNTGPANQNSA